MSSPIPVTFKPFSTLWTAFLRRVRVCKGSGTENATVMHGLLAAASTFKSSFETTSDSDVAVTNSLSRHPRSYAKGCFHRWQAFDLARLSIDATSVETLRVCSFLTIGVMANSVPQGGSYAQPVVVAPRDPDPGVDDWLRNTLGGGKGHTPLPMLRAGSSR